MSFLNHHDQPRSLDVLDQKAFSAWLDAASQQIKTWAHDHGFTAKAKTHLIWPSEDGGIGGAVMGADADDFVTGAMASRLPAGAYEISGETPEQLALGFALDQYQYDRFKTPKTTPAQAQLVIRDPLQYQRLNAIVAGVNLARDLINTPANYLTPQGLEDEARALAKRHNATIDVTMGEALAQRYPAIHTVGRAAEIPPRLIDLSWENQGESKGENQGGDRVPLITLIGKGITFDSGGLDLKPSSGMEIMKKDMGGAANVLGLAETIMSLGLNLRLRVLVPAAENAVSSLSMRPLDVINTAAGIPVEVGNTDAEGRLVLADALHLATADDPMLMIDFATLTGAARVAVGAELPALFSNNEAMRRDLTEAGDQVGDPLWPMPLHAPYDRYLDAGYAAMSSTGSSRYGGAITAALFLQRFLQKPVPWAHIDLMAWNLSARPGHPRGGEAMGLRAALELIERRLQKEQ